MASQDQLRKELLAFSRRKENALCADCRMPGPTWAAFNLGLFMCMTCSGHHRSLGTHISRVRSITLDNWDAPSVALMGQVGNVRANSFFEAKLPPGQRIHPAVDDAARGEFIKMKYQNRAWYGQPADGAAGAAAAQEVVEAKPLSKMEQRQARLQAKAAQPATVAQPQQIRQSSVPTPSHAPVVAAAAVAAAPAPTLFSGMNHPTPVVQAVPVHAVPASSAPVKQAPQRVHSASPWVSRSEYQHPQQQQPQHQQHTHVAAPTVQNLLDLPSISDTPAEHPAAGHAVDDLFAGMSLASSHDSHPHPHVNTSAANSGAAAGGGVSSSDLLSYYAEPASAPARSQHSQSPENHSSFSFMQPAAASSGGDMFDGLNQAPAVQAPVQNASSPFSFMQETSASGGSGTADASSAFSFLGDAAADAPPPALDGSDFVNLLAPAAAAAFPLAGVGGMLPHSNSYSHPPAADPMFMGSSLGAPLGGGGLPHSFSQGEMFGAGTGQQLFHQPLQQQPFQQPSQQPFQQPLQQSFQQQAPAQSFVGYTAAPFDAASSGSMLAPLPPLGGFGAAPAVPQFTVQSVQATQRAHAVAAQQHADDPFAHIASMPSPSAGTAPQPQYGGGGVTSPTLQPKGPNQCDVDGCDGKKVARGLCSRHIKGTGAAAPAASQGADASFAFLASTSPQQQQQQQQQAGADSGFSFLAPSQPSAAVDSSASSFSFLS